MPPTRILTAKCVSTGLVEMTMIADLTALTRLCDMGLCEIVNGAARPHWNRILDVLDPEEKCPHCKGPAGHGGSCSSSPGSSS